MNEIMVDKSKMSLLIALSDAKVEFTKLTKDKKGVYGKYAPLDSVIDATLPALRKYGLIIIHTTTTSNGNTDLHTMLCHCQSGESLESVMPVIPDKPGNQGLGASLTYLKRYQECMLLDLAAEDDDDLGDGKVTRPTQPTKSKPDGRVIGKVTDPAVGTTTYTDIPEDISSDPTANQKKAMAIASQLMLSEEIQHRQIKEKFNVDSRTQLSDIQWGQYAASLTKLKNGWSANIGGDGTEVDAFFKAMKETTPANRIALLKFFTVDNVLHITTAQFAMWKVVLDDITTKAAQPEL